MTTYDVIVFREDELWVADIVDLGATDMLRREIIRRMSAVGLSQRAIGDVLELSHQRVNQLANAS